MFDELWDLLELLFATKNVFFVYDYWAWEPLRITSIYKENNLNLSDDAG